MSISVRIPMPAPAAAISMAAVPVAVWMALAAPAAQAGFLYVPQDETAPVAAEAVGAGAAEPARERKRGRSDAPLRVDAPPRADAPLGMESGSAAAGTEEPGPDRWRVRPGEMLRDVLARWGGRAGVDVLFLTDRRYRLLEGRGFHGSFVKASQALLAALSHLPHPPVGEAKPDGGTLMVMHKASLHRADLHRPGDER